jgi:tetratricopeptide (TPR) repeat protein
LHEGTLKLREARLGPDHPDALGSRNNLALAYLAAGRAGEAAALWEGAMPALRRALGAAHPNTLGMMSNAAIARERLGRWGDAEVLWREVLSHRRAANPPEDRMLAGTLVGLGRNLLGQSRWSEAEPLLRECLAICEKTDPAGYRRFEAMSLLGGALLGQGRHAEAEPLILRGYEGVKARGARVAAYARAVASEAADRVVRLYASWGKPEQAAAWRAKLGLADLPAEVFARP